MRSAFTSFHIDFGVARSAGVTGAPGASIRVRPGDARLVLLSEGLRFFYLVAGRGAGHRSSFTSWMSACVRRIRAPCRRVGTVLRMPTSKSPPVALQAPLILGGVAALTLAALRPSVFVTAVFASVLGTLLSSSLAPSGRRPPAMPRWLLSNLCASACVSILLATFKDCAPAWHGVPFAVLFAALSLAISSGAPRGEGRLWLPAKLAGIAVSIVGLGVFRRGLVPSPATPLALGLLSFVAIATAVTMMVAALSPSHVFHPGWPPHAKFHATWFITATTLLGLLCLYLDWHPPASGAAGALGLGLAALLPAILWGSLFLAWVALETSLWPDVHLQRLPLNGNVVLASLMVALSGWGAWLGVGGHS